MTYIDHSTGAYCASKAAVRVVTETMRREMFAFGVNVILFEPTVFSTSMTDYARIMQDAQKHWTASDLEVRQAYGQQNFDFFMLLIKVRGKVLMIGMITVSDDIKHLPCQ